MCCRKTVHDPCTLSHTLLVLSDCSSSAPAIVWLFLPQPQTRAGGWQHMVLSTELSEQLLGHQGAWPFTHVPLSHSGAGCGNKSPKEGMEPASHHGPMCRGGAVASRLVGSAHSVTCIFCCLNGCLWASCSKNKTALKVSVSSFCFTIFLPQGLSELMCPAGINTPRVSAEKTGEVEEAQGGGVSVCCWFTHKSEPAYHSIGCLMSEADQGQRNLSYWPSAPTFYAPGPQICINSPWHK